MKKALLLTGLVLPLVACVALSAPLTALKGTPTPSPSWTAQPTLSLTPRPSTTPVPTRTPTITPSATLEPTLSPTPTGPSPSPAPTATTPSELACKLLWQSPGSFISYQPDEAFTVGWNVRNIGTNAWDAGSVEFTYLRGAKLYDYAVVHLVTSVAPGQDVILSVHMRAPMKPAGYTTSWSLRQGNTFFCPLMLSIYVEVP